jgi:hypothetical protein
VQLTPEQARQLLAALRIAVGVGAWLAPRLSTRFIGHRLDDDPSAALLWRLFGSRDIAMGLALYEGDEDEVHRWLTYGMAIDAADAAAALAAALRGRLPKPIALLVMLSASSAVALGARARGDL